jgi:hypothetical protein
VEDNRQILRDLLGSAGYELTEAPPSPDGGLTSSSWTSNCR